MPIVIRLEGKGELGDLLTRMRNSMQPGPRRALAKNLAALTLAEHDTYFRGAHSPEGVPWKPLSPVTIARRKKGPGVGGPRPLMDRGMLRLSVTSPSGGIGGIREISPDGFAVGSALPYAAAQHKGRAPMIVTVRPHVRRVASRNRFSGRKKIAIGIAFVRSYQMRVPGIPARPFVGFSSRLVDRITLTIKNWIERGGI